MKYLVIGAGGTGGCIAGFLTEGGKDVTLIARNASLQSICEHGLRIRKGDSERSIPVKAVTEEEYQEKADIMFLCVKGYSVEDTYPLLKKASDGHTIIIPILNIYGTGEKIAKDIPELQVLNGCIYIASAIEEPGVLRMSGDIFRIVYGRVDGKKEDAVLFQVEQDLKDSGITPIFSENVRRDTLQKYAMVSPMASVGAFYDISCGPMQVPGKERERYRACVKEIDDLANAMGIPFEVDVVQTNLDILDALAPDCTASMQKDLKKGGRTEMDGLIFEMVRMGHRYGVPVPNYEEIAAKFGFALTE
ncbi:MAG: 2-dehydropantoate 2-reductase [Clostridia bacterium]|nr:2-dehydropantoate 2-reductase [Clostridia bacterium]